MIFAMILCFSAIPMLVIGIAVPAQFTGLYTEKKLQEIEKFVRNRGEVIDLFFEERLGQLKSIGEIYSQETLTTPGKLSELLRILKVHTQAIVDLGVIDMEGRHIVYAGPYDVGTANYAQEDWFLATKRQGAHVSDVFLGFRQSPHIALAVLCGDGRQSWILRATINASMLTYLVKAKRTGEETGDVFILNEAGRLQTDSRLYGAAMTAMNPEWPGRHAAIAMEKIGNDKFIVATTPLHNVPWILACTEAATPFSKIMPRAFILSAGGILLALLALGVGAWFIARIMMKKLMEVDRKKSLYTESILQANKIAGMEKFTTTIVEEMNEPVTLLRDSGYRIREVLEKEDAVSMPYHAELCDIAQEIENQTNRTTDIQCRLLAFAQKLNPFLESIPLHIILNQALAFLQQEADDHETEIIREFGQPEARVFTDASQLQQALLHVIENAIEAAGKNGIILINSDIVDGKARIRVKDNGPGIPKEKLARIFDPLNPAEDAGKGFGLAISSAIMKRLGGNITASSSLEEGTVFTIVLPLASPDTLG